MNKLVRFLVAAALDGAEVAEPSLLSWTDAARWLRPRMGRLNDAFSGTNYVTLRHRISDCHHLEQSRKREWETEMNRKLYPDE